MKRYYLPSVLHSLAEHPKGIYILFIDHEAAIRRQQEEIAELKTRLSGRTYCHDNARVEEEMVTLAEAVLACYEYVDDEQTPYHVDRELAVACTLSRSILERSKHDGPEKS